MKQDIEGKRGLSSHSIGMTLLFWLGVIVNEMYGSKAEKLTNKCIEKLNDLNLKRL